MVFTPALPWPEKSMITVTLAGGQSAGGLPLLDQPAWSFTVAGQRLAYLTGATPNLWLMPLDEGAAAVAYVLTAEPDGIYNFDISPDGTRAVYAALRADGGADLRMLNLDGTDARTVLACPGEACLSPVFSPDGARIAYERQQVISDAATGATFGDSHVYL
jgi:Tol biopolymer transport system component